MEAGARYFDIRPVISAGKYLTGHYGCPKEGFCLGANGQSIESIVNDINTFTTNNKELVILKLSHDLNTDRGIISYAPFTQPEWDALFSLLKKGIKNLFIAESSNDLTKIRLKDFIGGGRAAVIVVVVPDGKDINLGDYSNQGFYLNKNFPVFDKYSESNDLKQMASDQLIKMREQRPNPDASYFLLSWTLTQQIPEVITGNPSILDLANKANPLLYSMLLSASSDQVYPNILYIDNIQSSDIAALAMAVNSKVIFGERAAKKPLAGWQK